MPRRQRISEAGLELVKRFEGFHARAASCGNGLWVIGHGHTRGARPGLRITRANAAAILRDYDLPPVEKAVREAILVQLRQGEFDALVSFAFNVGIEAFKASAVRDRLNAGERLAAADALEAWRAARFGDRLVLVEALARRRAAEKALFLSDPASHAAVPGARLRPVREPDGRFGLPLVTEAALAPAPTEADTASACGPAPAPETPAGRPGLSPTAPPEAAREVKERLTRILGAAPARPPESGDDALAETPDDIRRALSAIVGPGSPADPEDDLPPPPSAQVEIDDLAPARIDPGLVSEALANGRAHARPQPAGAAGMAAFAGLGLAGLALGSLGLMQQSEAQGRAYGSLQDTASWPGISLLLLGALLVVMSVYFGGKAALQGKH